MAALRLLFEVKSKDRVDMAMAMMPLMYIYLLDVVRYQPKINSAEVAVTKR